MSDPGQPPGEQEVPDPDTVLPAYEQPYAVGYPQAIPAIESTYPPTYLPFPPPQLPPRPSPFAGVPATDRALDAAAVVALLATLGLPWTAAGRGFSRPEVIAGVVLGLCAIALPYLSRMGLFGRSWTPAKLRVTKLLTAAPLALCAATYFVLDGVVGAIDAGVTEYAPSPGAWIATAAAVLAALPRRADLIDAGIQRSARLWTAAMHASCVALIACTLVAVVLVIVTTIRSLSAVYELRTLVFLPVIQTVLLGIWAVAVWRVARSAARGITSARLALAAAGVGALIWAVLSAVGRFTLGSAESLHLPYGGFTLTMVAALVAMSPSLNAAGGRPDPQVWLAAVRTVLGLVLVGNILLLVQVVVDVTLTGALTAVVFITAGGAGAGAIAADWARQQVAINPLRCRAAVLIAAALQASAGVAVLLVVGLSGNSWEAVTGPQVIAAVALPAAAVAFVTIPGPMRAFFPTPVAPQPFPQPGWPIAVAPNPARLAADPSTPPSVLYSLAQQGTAVWPSLAANPATPRELLAQLSLSADPAVQAALYGRPS